MRPSLSYTKTIIKARVPKKYTEAYLGTELS